VLLMRAPTEHLGGWARRALLLLIIPAARSLSLLLQGRVAAGNCRGSKPCWSASYTLLSHTTILVYSSTSSRNSGSRVGARGQQQHVPWLQNSPTHTHPYSILLHMARIIEEGQPHIRHQ